MLPVLSAGRCGPLSLGDSYACRHHGLHKNIRTVLFYLCLWQICIGFDTSYEVLISNLFSFFLNDEVYVKLSLMLYCLGTSFPARRWLSWSPWPAESQWCSETARLPGVRAQPPPSCTLPDFLQSAGKVDHCPGSPLSLPAYWQLGYGCQVL